MLRKTGGGKGNRGGRVSEPSARRLEKLIIPAAKHAVVQPSYFVGTPTVKSLKIFGFTENIDLPAVQGGKGLSHFFI